MSTLEDQANKSYILVHRHRYFNECILDPWRCQDHPYPLGGLQNAEHHRWHLHERQPLRAVGSGGEMVGAMVCLGIVVIDFSSNCLGISVKVLLISFVRLSFFTEVVQHRARLNCACFQNSLHGTCLYCILFRNKWILLTFSHPRRACRA